MSRLALSEYEFPSNDSLLFKTRNIIFTHEINANIISLNNYEFELVTEEKALNKILALVSFEKPLKMAIITQINGNTSIYTVRDKAEPHHMKLEHQNLKSISFNAVDDFLQISYISGSDIYLETLSLESLKSIDHREIGEFDLPIEKQLITEFATYIISQKKVYKFTNRGIDCIGSGEDVFEGDGERIYVHYKGAIYMESEAEQLQHLDQITFNDWMNMGRFQSNNEKSELVRFTELELVPTSQNYNFEQYFNYLILNNTDQSDYAAIFDFRTGELLSVVYIQKGQFYSIGGDLLVTEMSQQQIKKVEFGRFSMETESQEIDLLLEEKFQINPNYQPLQQLAKFFRKQDKLAFNFLIEAPGEFYAHLPRKSQPVEKIGLELNLENSIAALITGNCNIEERQISVNFADVVRELNIACERSSLASDSEPGVENSELGVLTGIICKLSLSTAYYLLVYRNPQILQKEVLSIPLLSENLRSVENFYFDITELAKLGNEAIKLFENGRTEKSIYSRELVLSLTEAIKTVDTKSISYFADKTFLELIAGMDYESELVGVKYIPAKSEESDAYDTTNVLSYIENLADRNTKKDKIIETEFQELMRAIWGENRSKIDTFKESVFRCNRAYLFRDIIGQEVAQELFGTYPEIHAYCTFTGAHSVCAYEYRELCDLTNYNSKITGNFLGILHEKFFNIQSLENRFGNLSVQEALLIDDIYQKIEDFYVFYEKFHEMNEQLIKREIMRGYEIIETWRPFLQEKEYMSVKIYEENAEVELRGHTMIQDDANVKIAEQEDGGLSNMKVNTEFIVQETSQYSDSSKRSEVKSQKGYINKLDRIAYAGKVNIVMNQGLATLRDEFDTLVEKKQYRVCNEHLDIITFILANMQNNSAFFKEVIEILCAEQMPSNPIFGELKILLLSTIGTVDRIEDVLLNVFENLQCDFTTFFELLFIACLKMSNLCMIHDIVEDIEGFGNLKQVVLRVIDKVMRLSITFDWIWKVW